MSDAVETPASPLQTKADSNAAGTDEDNVPILDIDVVHHGTKHTYTLPAPSSTLADLADAIHAHLSIPPSDQKFLISKLGLLKHPFNTPSSSTPPLLSTLAGRKIQLLAPTPADLASLAASTQSPPRRSSPIKPARPARTVDHTRAHDDITYTFHKIAPLPYLPNPARSQQYLERLAADAGIRAAMRAHRFSVGLLTEMNPAEHTTHESRTLGLNRNRGQVIELRLRTDAYDGYRDYRTIRKTLCHELAHNVFGDHDRDFWDLCKQIEKEVERGDWRAGGRSVGEQEFYNPDDWDRRVNGGGDMHVDGGGWTGGSFVLGGGEVDGARAGGSSSGPNSTNGLSQREIIARAAEERMKRQRERGSGNGGGGVGGHGSSGAG